MKIKFCVLAVLLAIIKVDSVAQSLFIPSGISGIGTSSTSYIGIGTSWPTFPLTVNGKVLVKGITSDNINQYDYGFLTNVTSNSAKAFCVYNGVSNKEVFYVWGNGVVNAKKIYAEDFEVRPDAMSINWFDNVFYKSYELRTLSDLEYFIEKNKHLPDIPSEHIVKKEGYNMAKMDGLLLKKIEELTLYIIQQQKEIDNLKQKLNKITYKH